MTRARMRRPAWWALVITLAAATLTAASAGSWQMHIKSRTRPPVADQSVERQAATDAAGMGAVKLLSYSFGTLEQDFSTAEALLTGDFLTYYKQFTSQTVRPAASDKHITQSAVVVRAGVESMTSQNAAVLVFVNETTTSQDTPTPKTTVAAVRTGLIKINGVWLINKFDPV
jgi:Mce-associated membrane protein